MSQHLVRVTPMAKAIRQRYTSHTREWGRGGSGNMWKRRTGMKRRWWSKSVEMIFVILKISPAATSGHILHDRRFDQESKRGVTSSDQTHETDQLLSVMRVQHHQHTVGISSACHRHLVHSAHLSIHFVNLVFKRVSWSESLVHIHSNCWLRTLDSRPAIPQSRTLAIN